MKMREQNTTPDPDKAYLTWALMAERDRLMRVIQRVLLTIPAGPMRAHSTSMVSLTLTEVKHDG